jgi:hypothetical protein
MSIEKREQIPVAFHLSIAVFQRLKHTFAINIPLIQELFVPLRPN